MARKLTASDRKRLIRMASEMPAGSPERKAILSGLAKAAALPDATRRSRKAYRDNERTHRLLENVIDLTISEWQDATSELFLNDLSKAYNQIDGFVNIAQRAENRLGELFVRIDGGDYADFYDDLMSDIYSLHEAYDSAQHELQQMVDDGLADEGNEDYVMRKMDDEVLPILEDAIAEFERIRVPRK